MMSNAEALRAWAKGYLPSMAAADFLIRTGQLGRAVACGLVEIEDGVTYLVSGDDWRLKAGAYSSSEYAILEVAYSLQHGDFNKLWSLGVSGRKALIAAIEGVEGA